MNQKVERSPVLGQTKGVNAIARASVAWTDAVVAQARQAPCTTVGLLGGSRELSDRRVTDRLAKSLVEGLRAGELDSRLLVVRLEITVLPSLGRIPTMEHQLPELVESPLGRWTQVTVPMPVGNQAPWTLEQLPRWLPKWKSCFGVILLDLGPMNLVPSRTIGRLCDSCYVLLGPNFCGSRDWVLQHLAWHGQCGSPVLGTLVTSLNAIPEA